MIIFWSGWGILAPLLIGVGIVAAFFGANTIGGANYVETHHWVSGVGLALGGALCWLTGKWLYGRSRRVLVDPATGREVSVGGSHTLFFIPMHWLGIVAILCAIPLIYFGITDSNRPKQAASQRGEGESPAAPAPEAAPAGAPGATAPATPQFATVAEAQQAAIRRYPELGVTGSTFNKKFLALHTKYRKERPELFQENNWPVVIADEVLRTMRAP